VDVPGYGTVPYSLAFGGNFYAMVSLGAVGLPFDRGRQRDILDAGLAIMGAINASSAPRHPEIDGVDYCHHVEFIAPGSTARHSRHAMAIYPGWFDRSPCGTGTSARMAELWARGELPLGTDFVNESFIGSRFTGRLVAETSVAGRDAVVPAITGRAWVTGLSQFLLDPGDPFPEGFVFLHPAPLSAATARPARTRSSRSRAARRSRTRPGSIPARPMTPRPRDRR
jgi:proline racemase